MCRFRNLIHHVLPITVQSSISPCLNLLPSSPLSSLFYFTMQQSTLSELLSLHRTQGREGGDCRPNWIGLPKSHSYMHGQISTLETISDQIITASGTITNKSKINLCRRSSNFFTAPIKQAHESYPTRSHYLSNRHASHTPHTSSIPIPILPSNPIPILQPNLPLPFLHHIVVILVQSVFPAPTTLHKSHAAVAPKMSDE